MKRTFTLNGKKIEAKEIGFNTMCDFESFGVSMETIDRKPMSAIRAYVAICCGTSMEEAGEEIETHIKNGGDVEGISTAFAQMVNESDFFHSLNKAVAAKIQKVEEAAKNEKEE